MTSHSFGERNGKEFGRNFVRSIALILMIIIDASVAIAVAVAITLSVESIAIVVLHIIEY